ncbi:MAG: hypothetical protein WA802_07560 [Terracidiphilus sp.]
MKSSRTITLFSESRDIGQRSTSFVASVLFHCVALGLLSFGVMYTPRLNTKAIAERYSVRNIDLETPEQQARRAARSNVKYPGPRKPGPPPKAKPDAGKPIPQPPVLRQVAKAQKGPQTLLQPDLPTQVTLKQEVPVPTMMIWSPKKADVKTVVAPQPEKPTAADVKPVPDPPNEEVDLSNISISAVAVPSPKLPTPPSTTSPIAIHTPAPVEMAPATVSQPTAQPTPAAIMSVSDLKMAQGTVVLPPVNESAATDAQGVLAPGPAQDSSAQGKNNQPGSAGVGSSAGNPGDQDAAVTKADGTGPSTPPSADVGSGQSGQPSATQITLPRDGQFGAVVVGESLDSQYPELNTVWGGRLAYTVFLHVGLARSWILQYSLPRTEEASAAGTIARLEAPWPYNIVRPNLALGPVDGNTIMIHGYVNQSGRFEALNIVFPPEFPQAPFVLKSLQNWQFRPASQNGQAARVEVLLIIPEELN